MWRFFYRLFMRWELNMNHKSRGAEPNSLLLPCSTYMSRSGTERTPAPQLPALAAGAAQTVAEADTYVRFLRQHILKLRFLRYITCMHAPRSAQLATNALVSSAQSQRYIGFWSEFIHHKNLEYSVNFHHACHQRIGRVRVRRSALITHEMESEIDPRPARRFSNTWASCPSNWKATTSTPTCRRKINSRWQMDTNILLRGNS